MFLELVEEEGGGNERAHLTPNAKARVRAEAHGSHAVVLGVDPRGPLVAELKHAVDATRLHVCQLQKKKNAGPRRKNG